MSEENKSIIERLDELNPIAEMLNNMNEKQKKKMIKRMKLPRKARISKSRKKKGWIGVLYLNPNRVVKGERVKLEGGTYRTKDDYIRVTDGSEIVWWDGKIPFIWQRYDKLNPTNLFPKEGDKNEMYGQDLVKLRYKKDLIKEKKKGGMSIVMILIILGGLYLIVKMFFPGLFGG